LPNAVVSRRTKTLKDEQRFIALHQLACLLNGLGWAVGIIVRNEFDFSSVDATLGVDLGKKGGLRSAYQRVGRQRPAVRHDIADLDLGIARTGIIFLLRIRRSDG